MIKPEEKKRRLIESLRLLSSDPETQFRVLPDFVHKSDELVLVFDECHRCVDELEEQNLLNSMHTRLLRELDDAILILSKEKAFWTCEKVRSAPEWEHLRRMAAGCLHAMAIYSSSNFGLMS
jgi:hypothetical protein